MVDTTVANMNVSATRTKKWRRMAKIIKRSQRAHITTAFYGISRSRPTGNSPRHASFKRLHDVTVSVRTSQDSGCHGDATRGQVSLVRKRTISAQTLSPVQCSILNINFSMKIRQCGRSSPHLGRWKLKKDKGI